MPKYVHVRRGAHRYLHSTSRPPVQPSKKRSHNHAITIRDQIVHSVCSIHKLIHLVFLKVSPITYLKKKKVQRKKRQGNITSTGSCKLQSFRQTRGHSFFVGATLLSQQSFLTSSESVCFFLFFVHKKGKIKNRKKERLDKGGERRGGGKKALCQPKSSIHNQSYKKQFCIMSLTYFSVASNALAMMSKD